VIRRVLASSAFGRANLWNDVTSPRLRKPEYFAIAFTDDDDDDWDIVGAELNNGQKIAIKYKKDYYQFEPNSEFDGQCESPEVKPTESEERLNKYILKLVDQMHRMVAANISGVSERKN